MTMRALALILCAAAGCQSLIGLHDLPPPGGPDATPGAPDAAPGPDAPPADAAPWTPASLPHLALWLDGGYGVVLGSGNYVTQWTDRSGHGNDAVQPNPSLQPLLASGAINNRDGIYFTQTGSPVALNVPTPTVTVGSGDFFIMVVYKSTLPTSNAGDLFVIEASGTTSASLQLTPPDLMASISVSGSGKWAQPTAAPYVDGNPHIAGMRRTGAALDAYGDGNLGSSNGVPTGDVSGKLIVGSQILGTIAEVIVDSGTVSNTQVDDTIAYLKKKYALPF